MAADAVGRGWYRSTKGFLTDEPRIGELWDRYKKHPRVMCTVQDDDFTARFRI